MRYTTQMPMLVSRQFDDEVILANFETGMYYSLAGTAADIWLGLKSGATVEAVAGAFESPGSQSRVKEVADFVDKLLNEKIVAPRDGGDDSEPWSPQFSSSFSEPVIEQFDDLRDLLFLDPVHDVGEAGWPVQAKDDI